MADSSFNAADLISHGYGDVKVVPVGVDPERLLAQPTDSALLRNLNESNPHGYVLAVAQILHHKRIEQLIEALHLCNSVHDVDLGLVIAGVSRQPAYMNGLIAHGKSLPNCRIRFLGAVTDRDLATAFRGARLFLSMSDHEGFSIPPLEAMSFGIPVIVKGAGAVPETVGDGALVLPATASIALAAEAIFEVAFNDATRRRLILQGLQRVKSIRALDSAQAARTLLMDAIK
jgi:glycosyltransferase involved in cell wall biosynthesis